MNPNDTDNLVSYRVELLEKQLSELRGIMQETHDAVTEIKARMGGSATFQCSVHTERMKALDERINSLEVDRKEQSKEIDGLKRFIWKLSGGLVLASILFGNVIAPYALEWIKGTQENHKPQAVAVEHNPDVAR